MRTKKPKIDEPRVRTPEEGERIDRAFYAGWQGGVKWYKAELERDARIVEMKERLRLLNEHKEMEK